MSELICSPVIPLYITWLPDEWNPFCTNALPNASVFAPFMVKAVQSPNPPSMVTALPITDSNNCPMVMRDGTACGLMMISGTVPSLA